MAMPLVVLAVLSFFIWYTPNPIDPAAGWVLSDWVKTPNTVVPESASFDFMQKEGVAPAGVEHSQLYSDTMHDVHYQVDVLVGRRLFLG